MPDRTYTAEEVDAAVERLSEPDRLRHAEEVVTHAAPSLQRVLNTALRDGGFFDEAHEGQVRSISDFIDFGRVQGFLHDKIKYDLEDLMRCGCESEPLGELLKQFEMNESHTFRILIKPFMDALTWDQDRIDRCCTHVIRPDGKLDSFCRYYSGFPDAKSAL